MKIHPSVSKQLLARRNTTRVAQLIINQFYLSKNYQSTIVCDNRLLIIVKHNST
jgi:hypothetical protein